MAVEWCQPLFWDKKDLELSCQISGAFPDNRRRKCKIFVRNVAWWKLLDPMRAENLRALNRYLLACMTETLKIFIIKLKQP